MDANNNRALSELGAKLTALSQTLGSRAALPAAAPLAASARPREARPSGVSPTAAAAPRPFTTAVLRTANAYARDAPLGSLLQKYRDAEAAWLKDKGKLTLAAKNEQQRRLKAEAELRRVQQQLAYRVGEVKHLKQALKGRDVEVQELRDRLREYELSEGGERTAQEAVLQAQAERDEMQSALHAMLQRLDDANTVIAEAEGRMSNVEARAEEAGTAQQCAEQQAAAAQCEVQQLREEVADLQWKCNLLQQLSDLTLQQNEEKSATLKTLLESESMLDATAGQLTEDGAASDTETELPLSEVNSGC